jgi:hypothetical protein
MGMLRDRVSEFYIASPADAEILRSVVSIMSSVDGTVATEEQAIAHAMFATIPQLRENPAHRPPASNRERLLVELGQLRDERLRKQCFVVAVEVALVADGANDAEDIYVERLRDTLKIDEAFARQTIDVLASKYACGV